MSQRIYRLKPTPSTHELYSRPMYHDIREELLKLSPPAPPAPNLVDWSAGRAPIRNQGDEGDCAGHQCRNARAQAHWFKCGGLLTSDYSVAYPYWQGRVIEGNQLVDSGMTIGDGLLGMENTGICEESYMPYTPGDFTTPPSDAAIQNALSHMVDMQAVPVDYSKLENIHNVLWDRHALIGGFSVPPSFEAVGSDGKLPDPTGEVGLGGHAFSIDMCNLQDAWFADPNSWGTTWGNNGVGYMPATYLGRVFELWAIVPVL